LELSIQLHIPAVLTSAEKPPVATAYKLGWDPEPVWTIWKREENVTKNTIFKIYYNSRNILHKYAPTE
jgi:hypothetical protein